MRPDVACISNFLKKHRTAQNDTKPSKPAYNNQKSNQSSGNYIHALDKDKKYLDMMRVICVK